MVSRPGDHRQLNQNGLAMAKDGTACPDTELPDSLTDLFDIAGIREAYRRCFFSKVLLVRRLIVEARVRDWSESTPAFNKSSTLRPVSSKDSAIDSSVRSAYLDCLSPKDRLVSNPSN